MNFGAWGRSLGSGLQFASPLGAAGWMVLAGVPVGIIALYFLKLKRKPVQTTHAVERLVRTGLVSALPTLAKVDVKMSVRRTFQALRVAVNDEFSALDALLRSLPQCLAPGGRVVMLTFHSGEDRRVKKAFQAGYRGGVYADMATEVIRSTKEETFANRRASAAKLRWAVRAPD